MNRDEIIRMAREVGFGVYDVMNATDQFVAFAALVAAYERKACLKLCDTNDFFGRRGYDDVDAIKAAIRARGETK